MSIRFRLVASITALLILGVAPVAALAQGAPAPKPAPTAAAGAVTAAAGAKTTAAGVTAAKDASTANQSAFVPLTNLPGVKEAGNSTSFPNFLNILYKLCIGAAAVIAVLQIMRAGVYFMFNKGSVAQNEQGKSLIQNAVLGLLLVLSPTIVFGIINPKILNLTLDVSQLQPDDLSAHKVPTTGSAPATPAQACTNFDKPSASTNACSAVGAGYQEIDAKCCNGIATGSKCCAKPKAAAAATPPAATTGGASAPAPAPAPAPTTVAASNGRFTWSSYFECTAGGKCTVAGNKVGDQKLVSATSVFSSSAACQTDFGKMNTTQNSTGWQVSSQKAPPCVCGSATSQQASCPIK